MTGDAPLRAVVGDGPATAGAPRVVPPVSAGVAVRVPASTANLGSGFDALGMALGMYDSIEVRVADSGVHVEVDGAGAESVPTDERHLVIRALRTAAETIGLDLPGVRLRARNVIPHARGLGSSAAAVVSGVAAAFGLAGMAPDERALQIATEFDGHADNVAASLYGGLVIAWSDAGRFHATRAQPHQDLTLTAYIPDQESSTAATRGLLPGQVPHADAAFAAGRAALAVHAITVAPELLLPATADRLHQDYREPAWPASVALVQRLRADGVAAVISGAGPTVLALADGSDDAGRARDADGFLAVSLPVDRDGVRVRSLGGTPVSRGVVAPH